MSSKWWTRRQLELAGSSHLPRKLRMNVILNTCHFSLKNGEEQCQNRFLNWSFKVNSKRLVRIVMHHKTSRKKKNVLWTLWFLYVWQFYVIFKISTFQWKQWAKICHILRFIKIKLNEKKRNAFSDLHRAFEKNYSYHGDYACVYSTTGSFLQNSIGYFALFHKTGLDSLQI